MRERIGSQHRRVAVAEAAFGSLGQRAGCEQAVHPAGKNLLVLVIDRRRWVPETLSWLVRRLFGIR